MLSNDILRSVRYILKANNNDLVRILALGNVEATAPFTFFQLITAVRFFAFAVTFFTFAGFFTAVFPGFALFPLLPPFVLLLLPLFGLSVPDVTLFCCAVLTSFENTLKR